jgi:hypothetical protein
MFKTDVPDVLLIPGVNRAVCLSVMQVCRLNHIHIGCCILPRFQS